ncbi:hypothetical protein Poli38472_007109 [Pythium oligandrum]|uniref:Uncharacterized protein n=1 Tax=Pythium oligandrum TaxID=41045 RepID=A0A8K1FFG4_PYTOL|nr:hypothetical protein Poli38472_007109 [Pythium oligandrum]|eukprot:TMW58964.1 hypothetical protein Poli38472_007109 [Pythium oligandrum]
MNKSKWEKYATQSTLEEYKASCERACSFRAPCCHNENYTHLPVAFNATKRPERYIVPKELRLVPSLKAKLPDLRQQIKRFANHKIPSSSLVRYIQEEFGKKLNDEQQHLLVEHLLPRILDEERRATFMMAYLAKYTITKTRCCGRDVCYNCKRKLSWHYNEGCSSVKCWCGFYMTWPEEIRIRDKNARGLIPVDIFDLEVYRRWSKWQYNIDRALKGGLVSYVLATRLSRLDQELPPYKRVLQEMLQRYIWWRRFRKSLPEFKEQLMKGSLDQETKRQTRIALRRRGAVMMVLRTS